MTIIGNHMKFNVHKSLRGRVATVVRPGGRLYLYCIGVTESLHEMANHLPTAFIASALESQMGHNLSSLVTFRISC